MSFDDVVIRYFRHHSLFYPIIFILVPVSRAPTGLAGPVLFRANVAIIVVVGVLGETVVLALAIGGFAGCRDVEVVELALVEVAGLDIAVGPLIAEAFEARGAEAEAAARGAAAVVAN